MDTLARFTLSVRKGYRPVAYHNFSHAFAVAHSMCVIMKMASDIFTCEEVHPLTSIYGFCLFFCLLELFAKEIVMFVIYPNPISGKFCIV